MDFPNIGIDLLRAVHLVSFAAGMGTGLYFDFIKFKTLDTPLAHLDIQNLASLHIWIYAAFSCLWLTGIVLIYVRTSFDLSSFSPKLWIKIGIMFLMVLNSRLIGSVVIPILRENIGRSLSSLPISKLLGVTQIGVISMYCWTSGLLLGSSVVLKTAPWGVVFPGALIWFGLLTVCGQSAVLMKRRQSMLDSTVYKNGCQRL
jgi:hypothetical protein